MVAALVLLLLVVVVIRVQAYMIGYEISTAEKKIAILNTSIRQNEVNISYLTGRAMLDSSAMAMRIDLASPKDIEVCRAGDDLSARTAMNPDDQTNEPPATKQKTSKKTSKRK